MNVYKIEDFLDKVRCGDEYVVQSPFCEEDIESVVDKSGYTAKFVKKYYKAQKALCVLGKQCINLPKVFELLQNTDELYSMKLKGEKNIRILFGFIDYKGKEKAVLYKCFEEKSTKDYKKAVEEATIIQIEIMERLEQ